jgi:predicted phosphodiesterase
VSGAIDVYIPIADWGVRADAYRVPLLISLRFRSVDRQAALTALRSGVAARAQLEAVERDLEALVRAELRRAALLALLGAAAGGAVAGLVLRSRRGRRWLLLGPLGGLAVAFVAIGVVALDLSRADYGRAIDEPTFYARGDELPELLDFSTQLLSAGERYTESFDQAVAGLTNLVAAASGGIALPQADRTLVVASDIHSNQLVLPVLQRYAGDYPVFLAGDFAQLGTSLEEAVAPAVARLGETVVAVSGNHDSHSLMLALARAGVTVLTRDGRLLPSGAVQGPPVVGIGGLTVAGYDDPLERAGPDIGEHVLELSPERFEEEARAFVDWFARLPFRPDVVLIHQHGLAHALLDHLEAGGGSPVFIFTGHDHEAHYHRAGDHLLLDGGSLGAGGPFAIGEAPAGFALLHLDADLRPLALDLIEVEPLSGQGSVRRVVPVAD